MAYDEELANRVRTAIGAKRTLSERKMFGGICFMLGGNMAAGVLNKDLIVRVAKEDHERFLKEPCARPFDFMKGRTPAGIMFVGANAVSTAAKLKKWVSRGVSYAESLPPK